ncbi:MAG: DUF4271 domain-containing protein [Bacteroidales bacterium]
MAQNDTITISDSLTCRYIIIDRVQEASVKEVINPVDSLWGSQTLSNTLTREYKTIKQEKNPEEHIISGFILLFLVLLLLFFREVIATVPNIIKNCFNFRAQRVIEEKLAFVNTRNIATLIAALFLTLFIVLTFGSYFKASTGIEEYMLIPASFGIMTSYWIFKSLLLKFAGWVSKVKYPFWLIGKFGYNHLILASIFTIPVIIVPIFISSFNEALLIKLLIISYLAIFILYSIRVYQIIISYHFSLFFYILYICTVEILPIALLTNFLLSYQ